MQTDKKCKCKEASYRKVVFERVWTVSVGSLLYLADKDGNVIYDKDGKPYILRKAKS